ncbi:MAG TPA: orotate phosphoribosyltransferase [Candidatus Limnocylindria bacterium]|nr:orotate phosphoribosyltransferase [Candidatus Limnocylindria bacterium]
MSEWTELGATLADLPGAERSRRQKMAELARDLTSAAYLRGDFVLSSGQRSNYYFDKYLFETKPGILRRVAGFMAEMLPPQTDRIAGTELGAVALATALSLETGLPFIIPRKEMKAYSTSKGIEGELYAGEKVAVIEDVISTGAQGIRAAGKVTAAGGQVVGIFAVIDREQGGAEAMAAAGYDYAALFTLKELGL